MPDTNRSELSEEDKEFGKKFMIFFFAALSLILLISFVFYVSDTSDDDSYVWVPTLTIKVKNSMGYDQDVCVGVNGQTISTKRLQAHEETGDSGDWYYTITKREEVAAIALGEIVGGKSTDDYKIITVDTDKNYVVYLYLDNPQMV